MGIYAFSSHFLFVFLNKIMHKNMSDLENVNETVPKSALCSRFEVVYYICVAVLTFKSVKRHFLQCNYLVTSN